MRRCRSLVAAAALVAGCADDGLDPPRPLPPLESAPLGDQERLTPLLVPAGATELDPRVPDAIDTLLGQGHGAYRREAGEPYLSRTLDGAPAPAPGPSPTLLGRFVHLADIQLADDESPARVVNVDVAMGQTSSSFRPHEAYECRILNAAVRTINRIHQDTPIDAIVLGGDNADNGQGNEVGWVLSILSGADQVDCDSGLDDDPAPGADNDPKDPFVADGLAMPYLWVTGNHDVLYQGNLPVELKAGDYLGSYAFLGTRDWSQPGGPVTSGDVPADERRAGLTGPALLARVAADGDGHGITDAMIGGGRANYAYDLPGTPLRFIVLDSAAQTGGADGLLHQADLDDFLIPALAGALADGKLAIVTSHHAASSLGNGGGIGGVEQPDAISADQLTAALATSPNLLMHLAGHSHVHAVGVNEPASALPYWEVRSAALADYPHQLRMIEVRDLDNGFYGVRLTAFDYQTADDPLAELGRNLGILDFTAGWRTDGRGAADSRNVELLIPIR